MSTDLQFYHLLPLKNVWYQVASSLISVKNNKKVKSYLRKLMRLKKLVALMIIKLHFQNLKSV